MFIYPRTILLSVTSVKTIDNYMKNLIQSIQETIFHATTFYNITSRSKEGFTKKCKEAQQNAKQLKKRWKK